MKIRQSKHLRFIAAIVGAVLPRHYWSRFDTVLPVSRAALGSSIATIFLAALIFIPASLRYVEGHAGAKRDELRAYRVLFHPGSRSHKVLLDNLFLLGSLPPAANGLGSRLTCVLPVC